MILIIRCFAVMVLSDGQWYIVYHGRDELDKLGQECRTARIAKLFAEDGVLRVEKISDDE